MIDQHACFVPALNRLGGDEELFIELAKVVLADVGPEMKRLDEAVAEGDYDSVAATGHRLKGMLSTFDNDTLTPEIQNLIDAARRSDRPTLQVAMRITEPLMQQLLLRLQDVVAQCNRQSSR